MLILYHHFLKGNQTHPWTTSSTSLFAAPGLQQIKLHVLMSRWGGAFWVLREGGGEVAGRD